MKESAQLLLPQRPGAQSFLLLLASFSQGLAHPSQQEAEDEGEWLGQRTAPCNLLLPVRSHLPKFLEPKIEPVFGDQALKPQACTGLFTFKP